MRFILSLALFVAFSLGSAQAAEQYQATQAYLNSFSDFYIGMKNAPSSDPETHAKIAAKTVDPAFENYARTTWEYGKKMLKDVFGYEAADLSKQKQNAELFEAPEEGKEKPDPHAEDKTTKTALFSRQIDLGEGVADPNAKVAPEVVQKKTQSGDNIVLDGSNIPKELEFRGPQKKKKQ